MAPMLRQKEGHEYDGNTPPAGKTISGDVVMVMAGTATGLVTRTK